VVWGGRLHGPPAKPLGDLRRKRGGVAREIRGLRAGQHDAVAVQRDLFRSEKNGDPSVHGRGRKSLREPLGKLALRERDGYAATPSPLGEGGGGALGEGGRGPGVRIEGRRDAQGPSGGRERVEENGGGRSRHAEARSEACRGETLGAGFEEEEVREVPFVAARKHGEKVSRVIRRRTASAPETGAPGVEHAPASDRLGG
jgi:hypothetical protein